MRRDPNDFELDNPDSPFWDIDEDNESYDDVRLCPRCEDHDMMPTARYCRFCEEEIWLDENA